MYVDLVLLLNWTVNYLLLRLTASLIRQKVFFSRLLLVAFSGALVPLAVYSLDKPAPVLWPARLLLPFLMIFFAFRPRYWRQGVCQYMVFYLCSIALGGVTLLFSLAGNLPGGSGEAFFIPPPSLLKLFGAAALLYTGVRRLEPLLLERLHLRPPPSTVALEVTFGGKSKILTAFVDTGNMLCCPFTGLPVAVAAYAAVRELLPGEICKFLESRGPLDWSGLEAALSLSKNASRFCIIPYHALQEKGFLLAFRPDLLKLRLKGSNPAVPVRLLIAVGPEGMDGENYEILLPAESWRNAVVEIKERNNALP